MSAQAIEVTGLSVQYSRGGRKALDELNFSVSRGAFFGLLGPNGSGKTTLISFLCGQVHGRYAKAQVLGIDRAKINHYKTKIGYAPQEIALYPTLSARANLRFFARLLSQPESEVDRVLEWVGLRDRADDRIEIYSGGMKRRLNLGVALLNRPELLILDEPTVGVDPQSRNFIFERILELKKSGVTLIYSTHYLEEVKRLCNEVGILQNGRMIASGEMGRVLGSGDLEKTYLALTGTAVEGDSL